MRLSSHLVDFPKEAAGDWINYGGDKIWPMPEGNSDEKHWILQSTAIDDLPYAFRVISQGSRCAVELTGEPDVITGLQYTRRVAITADSPQIAFHIVMRNATAHPIEWSVQSVSQYDLSDHAHQESATTCSGPTLPCVRIQTYPDGYHVRSGLAEDPAFSVEDGLFKLHWGSFQNEVWLDSSAGWLTVADEQTQYGMVERFDVQSTGNYPGKATVIFYKNGPSVNFDKQGHATISAATTSSTPFYMEAEINSPIVALKPTETYVWDTAWSPIRIGSAPQVMNDAGVVEQRLRAVRNGDSISVRGTFSVFNPGELTALLLDSRGLEVTVAILGRFGRRRVLHCRRASRQTRGSPGWC